MSYNNILSSVELVIVIVSLVLFSFLIGLRLGVEITLDKVRSGEVKLEIKD